MQKRSLAILEGDETGQELLEQTLRVLAAETIGFELELQHFDLSLANRRASGNAVVSEAAAAIRALGPVSYTHLTLPTNREV